MNQISGIVVWMTVVLVSSSSANSLTRLSLISESFEHGGAFPPPGWVVESQAAGPDWTLAGNPSDYWSRVEGRYSEDPMDERLISPTVDCTGYTTGLVLKWWNIYRTVPMGASTSHGYIDISTDGGTAWTTLKSYSTQDVYLNPDSVLVPQAANQPQVTFRWRYEAPDPTLRMYWEVDDLRFEATASHDVGVDSLMGPSANDRVRAGAAVRVWVRVRNYTGDTETDIPVTCGSSPAGFSSSTTVTLAGNESAMVSFPDLWNVPASGTYTLTATTSLPGDGDATNNASSSAGIVPVSFAAGNAVLLSWQDATERDEYQAALAANSVGYDSWDRSTNGNLYGLDAWSTVIFAEQAGYYPALPEQISLMRYLDEGSEDRGPTFLLISGNNLGYYYSIGTLKAEFFQTYLHATSDGDVVSPSGNQTYSAAPCAYIGMTEDTDQIRVSQTSDDEIGAVAGAETLYVWQWEPTPFPVAIQYASPVSEHVFLGFQFDELRFAAERNALMGQILAWFAGPSPPAGMGTVSISAAGANVTLTWSIDPSWVCPTYRIYRFSSAFSPSGAPHDVTDASPYTDIGAAGDPAVNHFYRITPVDFGVEGAQSATLGEFDFALP